MVFINTDMIILNENEAKVVLINSNIYLNWIEANFSENSNLTNIEWSSHWLQKQQIISK